eukprot:TRINITY_DN44823_c0_g1_i1.p1 TRINITY_DN44823_c0_g1~~TRINITY_DN44823_c0_g1_i1.p1  ORF type:complete len:470 (+),score=71.28 TRINITY_DN44823_c0_g1_i1:128-1537(+)
MTGAPMEEDLMKNPFLRVLRASFESLYRRAAERGEATTVLVPCAECLEGEREGFTQVFMEAHVFQETQVPCCFMNLLGQGVEIRDSCVSTDLGFPEERSCNVVQVESMYDFGNTFRVNVIDKPLIGKYRKLQSQSCVETKGGSGGRPAVASAGASILALLSEAPAVEDWFYDQLLQFRKTFVQVPGCEQSTAERIREIVGDAMKRLTKHHRLEQPTRIRQLDYQVSRNAYAMLHSFVFQHLQRILAPAERRLEKAIRSYDSVEELLSAVPGATGRGLGRVNVQACSDHLAQMDHEITPHEKIGCINDSHSALQRCIAEGALSSGDGQRREAAVEITGDDVLSLFIIALFNCVMKDRLAHIAYVEMYLQGAAGRSGSNEAARFEEAGYAVSALQAALQFFLDDSRRATPSGGHIGSVGGGGIARGAGYPSDVDADAGDRVNSQLHGLVRQARATQQQQTGGGAQRHTYMH